VTVYDSYDYKGNAAEFPNLCNCEELPSHFWNKKKISVLNNGNCVIVYNQSRCQGQSETLQGGKNGLTRFVMAFQSHHHEIKSTPGVYYAYPRTPLQVASIAPCDDLPQHCLG